MKKILLSILCCAGLTALHAQNDVIETSRQKDPMYIQLYAGINKSANENLPWTEFSKYPWAGGFFIGLGEEFTPLWGWRAALRYNHNKSRNVQKCENPDTWGWDNLGLFLDGTFDVSDAAKMKNKKFKLRAFAGMGMAYSFGFPQEVPLSYTTSYSNSNSMQLGLRIGLNATYQVANNWHIGMELSNTLFTDGFNGVKDGVPMDLRTNLKIGVAYVFTKPKPRTNTMPVVYDTRLKVVPALPFAMPEPEATKVRQLSGRAFLDFPVSETVIYPNYRRNPQELKRIIATVDEALFDKTIQVTNISLHGYASPESSYSNNMRLSKGRVAALRDYLQQHYKFKANVFTLNNTPEDWDNLRNFIADGNRRRVKGDIWYESTNILETPETPEVVIRYRDELLQVIDMQVDVDEKELRLKQVGDGEPYKWLLQYVYPGLRHTDYIIEYVLRQYPVKEGRRLIYTHPEALSVKEMYHVAQSYDEGSDGWYDALTIAAKQYPDDQTANLNAACASVKMKRLKDAKAYLRKAGNSDQTEYLQDVIKAMEGEVKWRLEGDKLIVE